MHTTTRTRTRWYESAFALAPGRTLCRNSVRTALVQVGFCSCPGRDSVQKLGPNHGHPQHEQELGIRSRPRKDSMQKPGLNRTGSSWLLLPPRERLCADTGSNHERNNHDKNKISMVRVSFRALSKLRAACTCSGLLAHAHAHINYGSYPRK